MIIQLIFYSLIVIFIILKGLYTTRKYKTEKIRTSIEIGAIPFILNLKKIDTCIFFLNFFLLVLFNIINLMDVAYCMEDIRSSNLELSPSSPSSSENSDNNDLIPDSIWDISSEDMLELPINNLNLNIKLGENTNNTGLLGIIDDNTFYNIDRSLLYLINSPSVTGLNNPDNICSELIRELNLHTSNCVEILKTASDLKLEPTALREFFLEFFNNYTKLILRYNSNTFFKITAFYESHFDNVYPTTFLNKISHNKINNEDLNSNIKSFLYSSKIKSFEIKSMQFASFIDSLNSNILRNININESENINLNISTSEENFELLERFRFNDSHHLSQESHNLLISKGFSISNDQESIQETENRIGKRVRDFTLETEQDPPFKRRLM